MKNLCLIALLTAMPMMTTVAHAEATASAGKLAVNAANISLGAVSAPEPASVGILATGGIALLMRRRKPR